MDKKYYQSKHWREFSQNLLDDKECICHICKRHRYKLLVKGKNKGTYKRVLKFSVHHINYTNINHETKEDVLLLCSACHTGAHKAIRAMNASPFHHKVAQLYLNAGFRYETHIKKLDTN